MKLATNKKKNGRISTELNNKSFLLLLLLLLLLNETSSTVFVMFIGKVLEQVVFMN